MNPVDGVEHVTLDLEGYRTGSVSPDEGDTEQSTVDFDVEYPRVED